VIGVGNYLLATPSELGNYKIVDTRAATLTGACSRPPPAIRSAARRNRAGLAGNVFRFTGAARMARMGVGDGTGA